jgi:putative glutamine amidotransferase
MILTVGYGQRGETSPYEAALRSAGIPYVMASAKEPRSLEGFAGLLLMGGTDVNPAHYGEARRAETDEPDDARDELELSLIRQALERDVPILAICRGLQLLNVQHGGTLFQHVEDHRILTPEDRGKPAHDVVIEPDTLLSRIAGGADRWQVNSRHHQAIARVGEGLRVAARDPRDGVIEALERPDKRFVVGVQWHPENQVAAKVEQARLFSSFGDAL